MEREVLYVATLGLGCLIMGSLARERARRVRAEHDANGLRQRQETTLRLLRLSTGDQRNLALTLFGHAESAQPPDAALSGLARRLLDMSEDLVEQTEMPDAPRYLSEETVKLMPVVEFAMAQVASHLGPSRRAWRADPAFDGIWLQADRRALNQVLVNVLSNAAAATRDGDWIEISALRAGETWCMVVQDEGIGLPMGQADDRPEQSRGIGLRLTLARSLMIAHDGSLMVETAEGVGTRVCLCFPATRLRDYSVGAAG
jgi:signal transduction histidine kinase